MLLRPAPRPPPRPLRARAAAAAPLPAPDIKLIVSDVDGTLLTSSHALTPRVAAAVAAAEAAGVPLLLATGKAPPPAAPWWAPVAAGLGGGPRPGVFLQGALLLDAAGRELYCATLHPDAVAVCAEVAAAVGGATLAVYASDAGSGRHAVLATALDARTARLDAYGEPPCAAVADVAAEVGRGGGVRAHKVIFLHDDPAVLADAHGAVGALLGNDVSTTTALAGMLEVLPPSVDKGDGVLRMLGELGGVDPLSVLALGDGDNDAPLLALAGTGVAVGNAGRAARAAASAVLAETNDEDAVAVGIERYVLGPRGVAVGG